MLVVDTHAGLVGNEYVERHGYREPVTRRHVIAPCHADIGNVTSASQWIVIQSVHGAYMRPMPIGGLDY